MIPRYFICVTCSIGVEYKYSIIFLSSLLFRLVTSMALDFFSLNLTLFLLDHLSILLSSKFAKFSTSLTDLPLVAISRSSAYATALVFARNFVVSNELNCKFQSPGPQHDPCGQPLVTVFSSCKLFVATVAVR